LKLDGGALLFKAATLGGTEVETAKVTARGIVEAYNLMNFDGVGVASQDLAAGIDFLAELAAAARFPWLSANLVDKATHKPLFHESARKRVGEAVVGITAVTDPAAMAAIPADRVAILPWQEVLPPVVNRLAKKSDLIILLSNLPPAENQLLAQALPAIDLILQAGQTISNVAPQPAGNSLVFQVGKQGKYVGRLDIQRRPGTPWQSVPVAGTVEAGSPVSSFTNTVVAMDASISDDGPTAEIVFGMKQQLNTGRDAGNSSGPGAGQQGPGGK